MRRRLLPFLILVTAALAIGSPGSATQDADERRVEVVEVSGPLDDRMAAFVMETIEVAAASDAVEVVVLQLDAPGVTATSDSFARLVALVSDPPVPVVSWVGPSSAEVGGGAAQLLAAAPLRAAAPGARIGRWTPTLAGDSESDALVQQPTAAVLNDPIRIDGPIPGVVDLVSERTASPRQLIQLLDGRDVGGRQLSTLRSFVDGEDQGVTALVTVYREPGLWDRTLRLGATPDVAFFLLVAGLTLAAFEFFAIGPGIAAVVAGTVLVLSGAGMGSVGYRWWALVLTVIAVWLLSVSYQRGGVFALSAMGLVGLTAAGFSFATTGPQIRPTIPGVLLTVGAAAFFFLLAMPTVARSRFSTQTIGREGLLGTSGTAVEPLDPDGIVEVAGARWRATSHRQAGIGPGDPVIVLAVDGWTLEVGPVSPPE